MEAQSKLLLSPEARIRLPDIDEALDKGHAIHGADDPALAGTNSQKLAQRIVDDFFALRPTPDTAEVPYLSAIHDIARGYGRALTRERTLWAKEIAAAEAERKRRDSQIRSRWESQGIGVMWKFLGPLILGLSGFLVAHTLGVTVLGDVADKTGTGIPSAIATLASILAGRILSRWWYDRRRDLIANACKVRLQLADEAYELAKLREFKHWRQKGVETWEQYTGEPYPERASYQMVMEGDMAARRNVQEHLVRHDKSDLQRFRDAVVTIKNRALRRNGKTSAPTPAAAE
jgi:hypothetical protein